MARVEVKMKERGELSHTGLRIIGSHSNVHSFTLRSNPLGA